MSQHEGTQSPHGQAQTPHGPTQTFEKRSIGALFSGGTIVLAIFLGVFAGAVAYGMGGVSFAIGAGVVVAALVIGGVYYSNTQTTVYATQEAIVTESEFLGSDRQFFFENIDIVVRKSTFADSLLGTGTYELVQTGDTNGKVWYLRDPEQFERLLADRVQAPLQQYRNADRQRSHFWHLWPHHREHAIPEQPVVEAEELESALDVDLSDVDLDGLDDAVGTTTIDDFDDVEAAVEGDGDAGAFDDGGGGGGGDGGFGGDGGGGGE